nr:MAG TPA: hypothetical protein [Siphoviridae sp. ctDju21]
MFFIFGRFNFLESQEVKTVFLLPAVWICGGVCGGCRVLLERER